MNNNYTEIAFILDRSGSMESCRDAAIDGFNSFLSAQQQLEGLAKLTLVLFDDTYQVPAVSLPVAEVLPLDITTYVTGNTTALLDAIGRTIDELGNRLSSISENDRPNQVIVAILTDGLENASQNYSWPDVADRIRRQSKDYKWNFLFLGANQDAIATAAQMAIPASQAASYCADQIGTRSSHRALSRKIAAIRQCARQIIGAPAPPDLSAPLAKIVEEERKQE